MKNSKSPNQSPQDGAFQDPERGNSHQPPPASFRLVEKNGEVEIKHVQTFLFQRIFPLMIGVIVISLMGLVLLGGRGEGSGLLVDLVKLTRDHAIWSIVVKYLVIALIVYLSFRIARVALGTLVMRVGERSFMIKKGILGVGFSRSVSRSRIKGLKQSCWIERRKNELMDTYEPVLYWKLELQGDKSITLLTDETNRGDTDWLGQYLSEWFEVPFVKEKL